MKKTLILIVLSMTIAISVEAQSGYGNVSFGDLDDVFLFIMPSKTFETGDGDLGIRCNEYTEGSELVMYFRGKMLSKVGWSNPNTVAHGNYAKLAVRSNNYEATFILHLPDGSHSKPYLYFEPLPTSTNRELAAALNRGAKINLPTTQGWIRFEPIIDGNIATLSFQPSSSKPAPIVYNLKTTTSTSSNPQKGYSTITDSDKLYDSEELTEQPSYPGGQSALLSFLSANLQYPHDAEEKGIQGKVVASFIVEKNGSLGNLKIERSVHPLLDKEVMRLLMLMPAWTPGKVNGMLVRVKYNLPVTFKVQ